MPENAVVCARRGRCVVDLKPPLPAIAAGVVLIVLLEFLVGGYSE